MKRFFLILTVFSLSLSIAYSALAEKSAYERWLEANNSIDYSDLFFELTSAIKTIRNGLDTGRIGTNKFKESCSLIFGEETFKKMTTNDIEKSYTKAKRYITGDVQGLQNGIDDMYKAGILIDNGDTYSFKKNSYVKDTAKALGLSEDVTILFLLSLTDYGWEVNIGRETDENPINDIIQALINSFSLPSTP